MAAFSFFPHKGLNVGVLVVLNKPTLDLRRLAQRVPARPKAFVQEVLVKCFYFQKDRHPSS